MRFNLFRGKMNPTRIVVLSFGLLILVGTLLLMLPFASRDGQSEELLTALFTATSATCVTGLVLVDTWLNWTLFGQIVILLMIQLGGLGFMTVITLFFLVLDRRITLSQRLLMVSTFNLNGVDGVVRLVRHALQGTFLIEGIGAVILSACFIPEYGFSGGVWRGIFHAVSAFCNAGFDLMGVHGPFSSLSGYGDNPVVLLTIMALIIVGGLGFIVWEDLFRVRRWKGLRLYSKVVLLGTAVLILLGGMMFLVAEGDNPDTLGAMSGGEKLLNALFQSVTLRTAGFNVIDQGAMNPVSMLGSVLFMLIGGCGGSTAGGMKVGTVVILLLAVWSGLNGREEVVLKGRSIPSRRVLDAMTLAFVVALLFTGGTAALTVTSDISMLQAAYETASAIGTVGVTTGITTALSVPSRLIVICLMFLGRVGILSFSMAFLIRGRKNAKIKYPSTDFMVG